MSVENRPDGWHVPLYAHIHTNAILISILEDATVLTMTTTTTSHVQVMLCYSLQCVEYEHIIPFGIEKFAEDISVGSNERNTDRPSGGRDRRNGRKKRGTRGGLGGRAESLVETLGTQNEKPNMHFMIDDGHDDPNRLIWTTSVLVLFLLLLMAHNIMHPNTCRVCGWVCVHQHHGEINQ